MGRSGFGWAFVCAHPLTLLLGAILALLVTGVVSAKRLVLGLATLYKAFYRWQLSLRGLTNDDVAHKRIVTGQTWEDFCDTLKAAGSAVIGHDSPKDPLSQAEGYRYLARLTRVALENFLECSNPLQPKLVSLANGARTCRVCIGSDNPDNHYQSAVIDSRYTYRVTGTRGTVQYLGFGVQAGAYGSPGGLQTVDYREAEELHVTNSGRITLLITPRTKNGEGGTIGETKGNAHKGIAVTNILKSSPEISHNGLFIVRQTFAKRDEEIPAELSIECISAKGTMEDDSKPTDNKNSESVFNIPGNISPADLDAAFSKAGLLVAGASTMFSRWALEFQTRHCNQLPLFDQQRSNSAGGDPNIRYYHSYWAVKSDEALVIHAKPPECQTWNFQLNNHWMESLDYRTHRIHTNKFLAKYRKDGSVCVVVSHRDPGIDNVNWLSTTGHSNGTMCWRWVKPKVNNDVLPHPKPVLVHFEDLPKHV